MWLAIIGYFGIGIGLGIAFVWAYGHGDIEDAFPLFAFTIAWLPMLALAVLLLPFWGMARLITASR